MSGLTAAVLESDDRRPAKETMPVSLQRTLLIALYRPLAIRLVLHSDVFRVLRERRDLRIVVLTPYPPDALQGELGGPNVVLEQLDLASLRHVQNSNRIRRIMRLIRLYTFNATKRRNAFQSAALHLYHRENDSPDLRWSGRLYHWLVRAIPRLLGRSAGLRKLFVAVEAALFGRNTHARVFETYKPDLMLVSSLGYGLDEQLITEAQRRGVEVTTLIQSWDNITTWGYPGARPSHVIVASSIMREDAATYLDIPEDRVTVAGVPHWDNYFDHAPPNISRREFFEDVGLSADRPLIYFACTTPTIFVEHGAVARSIVEAIRDGGIRRDAQLLIRPHPGHYSPNRPKREHLFKRELDSFEALARKDSAICAVDHVGLSVSGGTLKINSSEQDRIKARLSYSDVMVAVYSTQEVEAAIFDLPIVNIAYGKWRSTSLDLSIIDDWDHWRRVAESGGVFNARRSEDLIAGINRYLENRNAEAVGRRRIVDEQVPINRGNAGAAIAGHILGRLGLPPEPKAKPSIRALQEGAR